MDDHTYNIYEAKTQFSKLIEAVEAGEDVTICRRGTPIAKLSPVGSEKKKSPWGAGVAMRPDNPSGSRCPRWTDDELDEMGL